MRSISRDMSSHAIGSDLSGSVAWESAVAAVDRTARRYCASHKNWIRNIRFSLMNHPLNQ